MDLKYRRAAPADVDPLHAIVAACGRHLRDTLGLAHWDPPYPLDRMRKDAAEREVWVVWEDGLAAGTFTIGETPLAGYQPELWSEPLERALYVNRLAIRPQLQRRGLGGVCMAEIERLARSRGLPWVRLDAATAHTRLCNFYRKLGYSDRGPFDNQGVAVTCFERCVRPGADDTR